MRSPRADPARHQYSERFVQFDRHILSPPASQIPQTKQQAKVLLLERQILWRVQNDAALPHEQIGPAREDFPRSPQVSTRMTYSRFTHLARCLRVARSYL